MYSIGPVSLKLSKGPNLEGLSRLGPWLIRTVALWCLENNRLTPRTIARLVPSPDPPLVSSTAQGRAGCDRASRAIAVGFSGGVPLLVDIPRRSIHPQVIPGRVVDFVPCVSGIIRPSAACGRNQGRDTRHGRTERHRVAPGSIAYCVPGLDPPGVCS
jgi:hypothetical protein